MSAPPDLDVRASLSSHPRFIQFVRVLSGEGALLAGFGEDDGGRIELAVVEGFTNIIRHGYGGRTDQRIDVRLEAGAGRLRVEFEDWATFVDPSRIASRPLEQVRPGGLGVHLMKSTMDVVDYVKNAHGGTTLVLEKRVSPP
jgi:sigma-B regulation protein RsbU (phosphoserine phosphatase)